MSAAEGSRRDVTLISTADWDHPFWTNKQHVACSMAELGHRVLYVESLGLRPPRLEAQDLRRVFNRLVRGLRPPRRVRERVWVWSPLLIPGASRPWQQQLNRWILQAMVAFWQRWLGLRADLLWTYNPLTLRVLHPGGYRQLVYHCVDDLAAQPCMPVALIQRWEERLCRASTAVFVTSRELERSRRPFNANTVYWSNVADLAHFLPARGGELPLPADLLALPGPRLGFVGAVSGYKLDLGLLRQLALQRPDLSLVLIGRVGEGDPGTALKGLDQLPNVHLLGPRPYSQLPGYLAGFDLALLPCPINPYTRSMFPMKFFEYLAAGLPVVATNLPALQEFGGWEGVSLCPDPEAFLQAVDHWVARRRQGCWQPPELPEAWSYRGRTMAMLEHLQHRQDRWTAPVS